MNTSLIVSTPEILDGTPVFAGTRAQVIQFLEEARAQLTAA